MMHCCLPEHPFGHRIYVCGVNGCTKTCLTRWCEMAHTKAELQPWSSTGIRPYWDGWGRSRLLLSRWHWSSWAGYAGQHPWVQKVNYHPLLDGAFNSVHQIKMLTIAAQELRAIVQGSIYHLMLHPLQTQVLFQMTMVPMRVGQLWTGQIPV